MEHYLWEVAAVLVAFLAHFLGIKVGGVAALRAAPLADNKKAQFPWKAVISAFLEFLLQVIKSPGVLKTSKAPLNGRNRQNE